MVIMALDHVRDYFTDVRFYPLDLSQTNAALYFTRWITHFCAPVFVFLAGTGAFLSTTRGRTKSELSKFLVTRGLWLVFLELTWVRFGWLFNLDYTWMFGQVIWAIGWSMVALAALIHLSNRGVIIFGVVMIVIHNAFDGVSPEAFGSFAWLWQILHAGGEFEYLPGYRFGAFYPLIPWIGVMAAGYGFGSLMIQDESTRRKMLLRLGFGMIAAFIVVRATNLYGDPQPWSQQKDLLFTFFSFINVTKYPPSFLFLLITLGPAIASLAYFELVKGTAANFIIVFGRVPMFYYLLHIPLIHALAVVAAMLTGYDPAFMFQNTEPWNWPGAYGFGLPVVYLVWAVVVLALYPACKWFSDLKRRRKDAWLSYF